jgi:DNA-binding MarR family transcriptional regulator
MNLDDIHYVARCLRERALAASIPALDPPLIASEIAVLSHLVRHPKGARVGDIARGTLLAQSRVSTVVMRLKKRGWITTRIPPEDARSTVVAVLPEVIAGTERVLQGNASALIERMLPGASPSERLAVIRGLSILVRELRSAEPVHASSPVSKTKGPS